VSQLHPDARRRLIAALRECATSAELTATARGRGVSRDLAIRVAIEEGIALPHGLKVGRCSCGATTSSPATTQCRPCYEGRR